MIGHPQVAHNYQQILEMLSVQISKGKTGKTDKPAASLWEGGLCIIQESAGIRKGKTATAG